MNTAAPGLIHLDRLGLDSNPFPVAPDASNYFMSNAMQENLVEILHCIDSRKGFVLISGDVGIGKTTLSRRLLRDLGSREISTSLVLNTFLQGESLIAAINRDFGIDDVPGMEQRLAALNGFLLDRFSQGGNCVIMIDDAQNLSLESLELIRQISNLETEQEKLVQIVLIAQPEILDTLARPDIRQLNSRIALNVRMPRLSRSDLRCYVQFRLQRAGSSEAGISLTPSALAVLYNESHGFPRRVNLIMDRCLYVAAAYDQRRINAFLLRRAARELSAAPHPPRRRNYLLRLVTTVVIAVVLGWYVHGSWLNWGQRTLSAWSTSTASQAANQVHNAPREPVAARSATVAPKPTVTPRLARVRRFLATFALDGQAKIFLRALDDHRLDGLRLAPGNWRVLTTSDGRPPLAQAAFKFVHIDGSPRWAVLWQPTIEFSEFYFHLHSESVAALQAMLADLGYYQYTLDGIVGARTVAAIARFQSGAGLLPTGNPDSSTLYALQRRVGANHEAAGKTDSLAAEVVDTTQL